MKPLTMTAEREAELRFAAGPLRYGERDEPIDLRCALRDALATIDALRAEVRDEVALRENAVRAATALRAELRDVKAERDIAVRERDDYYGALALLREAVLEIAELAQTTEGEDTGEFLAYRLREAVGK